MHSRGILFCIALLCVKCGSGSFISCPLDGEVAFNMLCIPLPVEYWTLTCFRQNSRTQKMVIQTLMLSYHEHELSPTRSTALNRHCDTPRPSSDSLQHHLFITQFDGRRHHENRVVTSVATRLNTVLHRFALLSLNIITVSVVNETKVWCFDSLVHGFRSEINRQNSHSIRLGNIMLTPGADLILMICFVVPPTRCVRVTYLITKKNRYEAHPLD